MRTNPIFSVWVNPAKLALDLLRLPEEERGEVAVEIWSQLADGDLSHPLAISLAGKQAQPKLSDEENKARRKKLAEDFFGGLK